ncbi:MFS transporter [Streptomyces sp. NPDC127033]|uniref:MFS transporter n=1 Tax=Streptomyces sp. NPDC127033 TaxID=3347110 RepID=UPI003650AAB6
MTTAATGAAQRGAPRPQRSPASLLPFTVQLALLVAMAFAIPAQLYLAIPVADRIRTAYGVDAASAAWTGAAFSFAYALGFLVFGPLSDRVGRRPVLAGGALATAVTTAMTAAAPGLGWFLAGRALQGFAAATFAPVALAYVTERAPAARRPVALSLLTTGLLGAGIAGQVFGELVTEHADWRAAFWPAALVYAAAAVAFWRILAPDSGPDSGPDLDSGSRSGSGPVAAPSTAPFTAASTAPSARAVAGTALALLRTRGPAAVFAAALPVFGSFVAFYAVLERELRLTYGFDSNGLLLAQTAGALGLLAGPLVNRRFGAAGPRALALAGYLTASAGLLLALLAGIAAVPGAMIGAGALFVAGTGLIVPGIVGLLHHLAPHARGTAGAVNTFALFAGASAGQLAAAHLGLRPMLAVLVAATLLACLTVATGTRPRTSPSRPDSPLDSRPDSRPDSHLDSHLDPHSDSDSTRSLP